MATFTRATRHQAKLRLALMGPTGSGKTMSALRIAKGLGGPIAFIDTERGSASLYSDVVDFDVLELESYSPENYIDAIQSAEAGGYKVVVIDSLSHAWSGKDGILEYVDKRKAQARGNDFSVWRDATPKQNALIDAILGCKMHVIATMRTKMEYVIEKDERTGKSSPRKVGLAPVQRDQVEYEFTLVGEMDPDHRLIMTKSRISSLADAVIEKPGEELAATLLHWLNEGDVAPEKPAPPEYRPTIVAPANVWDKADLWMLQAKDQLAAWEMKFTDVPEVVAMQAPNAPAALFAWSRTLPEGTDPLDAFLKVARAAMPKEEAQAS